MADQNTQQTQIITAEHVKADIDNCKFQFLTIMLEIWHFGYDCPLGYVRNKFLLILAAGLKTVNEKLFPKTSFESFSGFCSMVSSFFLVATTRDSVGRQTFLQKCT